MAQSNVEIVRAVFAGFTSGDLDTALELCHPDVEFDWSRRLLDPVVTHGRDGVRKFYAEVSELFDQMEFKEEEITDFGDQVLYVGSAVFHGRSSGAPVAARAANLWTIEDGKVVRFRFYQTKDEALEALQDEQRDEKKPAAKDRTPAG